MIRRNIELKARLESLPAARRIACQLTGGPAAVERQRDTYFNCRSGRLKLRQREGLPAQLVWYKRPDDAAPKPSSYHLVEVADPSALEAALTAALGVLAVVDKRREVYLAANVRIHLDQVAGLGDFMEFEAVLAPGDGDDEAHAQLAQLCRSFGIEGGAWVAGSYSDLLLERGAQGG